MKPKKHKQFEEKFKERLEYYNFNDMEIKAVLRIFNYVLKQELKKWN